jgi:pimeloyl-ACP methyl ester carboxylesterase
MVRGIAADFFDPRLIAAFQEKYRVQMQFKGFLRAILSTMRSGMLGSFLPVYTRLGRLGKPTLLFWGRDDRTVPFRHSSILCQEVPQGEFHALDDCGHIPHFEKPQLVNPLLLEFLKRSRP